MVCGHQWLYGISIFFFLGPREDEPDLFDAFDLRSVAAS